MKFAEHITEYLAKGLQLTEITQKRLVPAEYRKFQVEENLYYFVHWTGHTRIGKTLNTSVQATGRFFANIARWEGQGKNYEESIIK